jgi:hypothetical protein
MGISGGEKGEATMGEKDRAEFGWVALLVVITVCCYVGFEKLFLDKNGSASVVTEFSAGAFGAAITAVITMILLRRQTEHQDTVVRQQQKHAKDHEIFKEQVALFKDIVTYMETVFLDDKLTRLELNKFTYFLTRLRMLAGEEAISDFRKFYTPLLARYNAPNEETSEEEEFTIELTSEDFGRAGIFFDQCRVELGLSEKKLSAEIVTKIDAENKDVENTDERRKLARENRQELDREKWKDKTPRAFTRIQEVLQSLLNGPTVTSQASLNYTQQYIAIVVESAVTGKAKKKILVFFEPSRDATWARIVSCEDKGFETKLLDSFGDVKYIDKGYRFKISLDAEEEKWLDLKRFIMDAAAQQALAS